MFYIFVGTTVAAGILLLTFNEKFVKLKKKKPVFFNTNNNKNFNNQNDKFNN